MDRINLLQNHIFPHCHHRWFSRNYGVAWKFVTHIAVVTAETYYPLTNAALILYLVSINVHQALINVNESNFFLYGGIQLLTCFVNTFMSDVILQDYSFSSVCNKGKKKTDYWQEGSTCTIILALTFAWLFFGQHIRRRFFRATLAGVCLDIFTVYQRIHD